MISNGLLFGLVGVLTFARAAPTREPPYFTLESAEATVYYDLTGQDACANTFGPNWSETTGNTGPNARPPACETTRAKTLSDMDLVTAIAFNDFLVDNDLLNWCGRIVNVYRPDGTPYTLESGPFFIWDGCGNCHNRSIIDLSSEALIGLQEHANGTSGCDNPQGLRVEVTNDYYWKLKDGGEVNENPTEADRGTGTFVGPIPTDTTHSGPNSDFPTATWAGSATGQSSAGSAITSVSSNTAMSVSTGLADTYASATTSQLSGGLNAAVPTTTESQHGASNGIYNNAGTFTTSMTNSVPASQTIAGSANTLVAGAKDFAEGADTGDSLDNQAASATSESVGSSGSITDSSNLANATDPVSSTNTENDGISGSNSSDQVGSQIPNSEECECDPGTYTCEGLELRICGNIQAGTTKVGKSLPLTLKVNWI
uniref:Uncharacterized protein n=1 Tax=Kwoniella pini CBS 10737 TaxID=1296096 RepID=A0A1B9HSM1_9TREE|nr:uncharacterized protein I206_07725 [Kwoniella pini CBS 10737]OCF46248.1 hypothetical protein I206_07725 [Kwoniella pini CBS 10737]